MTDDQERCHGAVSLGKALAVPWSGVWRGAESLEGNMVEKRS